MSPKNRNEDSQHASNREFGTGGPDAVLRTGKPGTTDLTEQELAWVSGGAMDAYLWIDK